MREFRRQIWLDIALFNKFVLLTCTGIAALILQITNDLGTVAQVASFSLAAAIHLILNAVLVLISFHLSDRTPFRALLNMLSPGPSRLFALIYPLLGVLGGATAVIYTSAPDGKWVALVLLIPLLFARLGLVGAQEQLRLSQLVEDQQRALLDASEELFRDREAERKRIAGELHDSSLGHLAGVILTTRRVREALETAAVDVNSSLALIEDLTEQSAAGIRASLEELRQSQIERAGLIATAEKFVRDVQTVWPIKVDIQWSLEAEPPGIVALTAFQILQEAVTNAVKHAEAGRISIAVTRNNSFIELSVEDDGRGFEDPAKEPEGHYGLHLMRERVESAGGELTIVSGIDQGTQLLAKLPAGPTS